MVVVVVGGASHQGAGESPVQGEGPQLVVLSAQTSWMSTWVKSHEGQRNAKKAWYLGGAGGGTEIPRTVYAPGAGGLVATGPCP